MGDVGLVLVHAVNDDAQVLGRPLLRLVAMFCVLLTLVSTHKAGKHMYKGQDSAFVTNKSIVILN